MIVRSANVRGELGRKEGFLVSCCIEKVLAVVVVTLLKVLALVVIRRAILVVWDIHNFVTIVGGIRVCHVQDLGRVTYKMVGGHAVSTENGRQVRKANEEKVLGMQIGGYRR